MKKRIVIIIVIVLLAAIAITTFVVINYQRNNDYPFLEFYMMDSSGRPLLTFIVERDGTFVSYYWLRPSGVFDDREEVILSRQEFQRISELIASVVEDYHYAVNSQFSNFTSFIPGESFIFKHRGYEYVNSNRVPGSLIDLYIELMRLSPLRIPW